MSTLKNKTIWITGASSGIGEALAYACASQDARLILTARNAETLSKVKKNCKNPDIHQILPLDLSDIESCRSPIKQILAKERIDILVNNAGIGQRSGAMETDLDQTRYLMEVNFFSVIELSRLVIEHFRHHGDGHLVIVSSVMGQVSLPRRTSYAASKHALHGFFDGLRAELKTDNIPVTLICPGYVRTNLADRALYAKNEPKQAEPPGLKGIDASTCAKQIVRAIVKQKPEVYIGSGEVFAVYMKRFFPSLWRFIMKKLTVN